MTSEAAGAFTFETRTDETGVPRALVWRLAPGVETVPAAQQALKARLDSTLMALRLILPPDHSDPRIAAQYGDAFQRLTDVARLGLTTPAAPAVAAAELETLRADLVLRAGPRTITRYLGRLGWRATLYAVLGMALHAAVAVPPPWVAPWVEGVQLFNLPVMWSGAMAGAWLSVGLSRRRFAPEDLALLADVGAQGVNLRLLYVGLLTIVVGLVLLTDLITVSVGHFTAADLEHNWMAALLLGAVCGIGERAVSDRVMQQTKRLAGEDDPDAAPPRSGKAPASSGNARRHS